mmetsp:Transcript_18937/g.54030  ORF Transcript_18937/g.54030 Transcript_18937/m.54030 type:complete len:203 (+) Transcript_18937:830-1438(+)
MPASLTIAFTQSFEHFRASSSPRSCWIGHLSTGGAVSASSALSRSRISGLKKSSSSSSSAHSSHTSALVDRGTFFTMMLLAGPGIAWMCAPKFCDESLQTSRCSNKAWKVCGRFKSSQFGKYIARKSPGGGGFARTCQSSARAPEIDVVSLKISFSSVLDSVSMTWSGAARRGGTAGAKRALAVVAAHSSPRITRGRAIAQA